MGFLEYNDFADSMSIMSVLAARDHIIIPRKVFFKAVCVPLWYTFTPHLHLLLCLLWGMERLILSNFTTHSEAVGSERLLRLFPSSQILWMAKLTKSQVLKCWAFSLYNIPCRKVNQSPFELTMSMAVACKFYFLFLSASIPSHTQHTHILNVIILIPSLSCEIVDNWEKPTIKLLSQKSDLKPTEL